MKKEARRRGIQHPRYPRFLCFSNDLFFVQPGSMSGPMIIGRVPCVRRNCLTTDDADATDKKQKNVDAGFYIHDIRVIRGSLHSLIRLQFSLFDSTARIRTLRTGTAEQSEIIKIRTCSTIADSCNFCRQNSEGAAAVHWWLGLTHFQAESGFAVHTGLRQ